MGDATEHRDRRFPISILGIGSAQGATIPLDFVNQPGQVLRSQRGEPIIARLDPAGLQSIVETTYGRYHTLTLADDDIEHLLGTPLPGDDETDEVERDFDTWADMGFWVAVLLIPVVLGGFRRGALALVPLCLLPLLPAPAHASVWDDLWQRRDQQGYQALQQGEPETAATLFEEDSWRAAALYRSDEFEAAADRYRRQRSTTAMYNLGNALARQQQYQPAIEAYEKVLEQEPGHEDARFNKALLERLEDEQSSEQDNQANQQQGGDQPEDSSQPQGDSSDSGQGDESQQGQPPQDTPPSDADGQPSQPDERREGEDEEQLAASRDEREEALEQWLRRVPDDPGGLLRRKFQYETNQRLRRGDYRSQETDKIW
jgi:Ca-activated chloride channel family protein